MGFAITLHPDWEDEPHRGNFERIYRNAVPLDRYVCYITGRSKGRRYCRTVEKTGRELENMNTVNTEVERIRSIVMVKGPIVCLPLQDGGDMPSEKQMPPLE